MQDAQQQQMFSYIFTKIIPTEFGFLKLGVAFGFFNCLYKIPYLKYKSKLKILSKPNEFVRTKLSKHYGKCTDH